MTNLSSDKVRQRQCWANGSTASSVVAAIPAAAVLAGVAASLQALSIWQPLTAYEEETWSNSSSSEIAVVDAEGQHDGEVDADVSVEADPLKACNTVTQRHSQRAVISPKATDRSMDVNRRSSPRGTDRKKIGDVLERSRAETAVDLRDESCGSLSTRRSRSRSPLRASHSRSTSPRPQFSRRTSTDCTGPSHSYSPARLVIDLGHEAAYRTSTNSSSLQQCRGGGGGGGHHSSESLSNARPNDSFSVLPPPPTSTLHLASPSTSRMTAEAAALAHQYRTTMFEYSGIIRGLSDRFQSRLDKDSPLATRQRTCAVGTSL